jgi:hypothetical protein
MSLAAVRPLFRDRLNALGYREHSDAFDDLNREQTKLDKMYRLEVGTISGNPSNQSVHEFDYSLTVQLSVKGGRSNVETVDRAFGLIEEIYADLLQESVRIGTVVKNIEPGALSVAPYEATSDDSDLLVSIDFVVTIYCQF